MASRGDNSSTDGDRSERLFIDAETIERLTPMPDLIRALEEVFRAPMLTPPRQAYQLPGGATLLVMPAWRNAGPSGIKIVTIQPAARPSIQSTYLLMDGHSGAIRAILDGTMLTPRRTAAASALASTRLARADAATLLMVGTGALIPHLVEAHVSVRPINRVLIWGRDPGKAQVMATVVSARGASATAVVDLADAVARADIVSAATLSTSPLIAGEWLRPGTHVDLVGAFRPDMAEAAAAVFSRARVFVDTIEGALEEAGDLLQAIAAGAMRADLIAGELADLCAGKAGRESADEITVFKSVGASIEDLVAAELVYRALIAA